MVIFMKDCPYNAGVRCIAGFCTHPGWSAEINYIDLELFEKHLAFYLEDSHGYLGNIVKDRLEAAIDKLARKQLLIGNSRISHATRQSIRESLRAITNFITRYPNQLFIYPGKRSKKKIVDLCWD